MPKTMDVCIFGGPRDGEVVRLPGHIPDGLRLVFEEDPVDAYYVLQLGEESVTGASHRLVRVKE